MKIKLTRVYTNYCGDENESIVEFEVGKKFLTHKHYKKVAIKNMASYKHYDVNDNLSYSIDEEEQTKLRSYYEKIQKQEKKEKNIEMMFIDTVSYKEIKDEWKEKGYCPIITKTKISFLKKIDENHYYSIPEFSINIKAVKEPFGYEDWETNKLYNKNELKQKIAIAMEQSKNITKTISDKIKNDLYEKYHVVVFNMKSGFNIGMSYKGDRNSMYSNWCHSRGTAKLKYNAYSEKKLYELAEKICNQNKKLF